MASGYTRRCRSVSGMYILWAGTIDNERALSSGSTSNDELYGGTIDVEGGFPSSNRKVTWGSNQLPSKTPSNAWRAQPWISRSELPRPERPPTRSPELTVQLSVFRKKRFAQVYLSTQDQNRGTISDIEHHRDSQHDVACKGLLDAKTGDG